MDSSRAKNRDAASGGASVNGEGASGVVTARDCRLHEAAFYGDLSEVNDLLDRGEVDASAPDKHGELGVESVGPTVCATELASVGGGLLTLCVALCFCFHVAKFVNLFFRCGS